MRTAERPQINQNQIGVNELVDHELRVRTDTETWLAEALHGSMQTTFEFGYDGEVIRGEDGGSLDEIFDDSIAVAREMTEHSPNMLFELRRRITERGELEDMYGMLNGDLPNTMIVVSDFPEELKNEKKDKGGYNVDRQQTMVRIITAKDDKASVTTISLDGSNRQALEAVYGAVGEPVKEGEMLGQRVHRDLDETWQQKLPGILRDAYDDSMEEQTGIKHYAGIKQKPTENRVDTYKFALEQTDLVYWFTQKKLEDPAEAEKHRYNVAATAKARHEKHLSKLNGLVGVPGEVNYEDILNLDAIDTGAVSGRLWNEMEREGRRATRAGETFSGCGATVSADKDPDLLSSEGQLSIAGYGGLSSDMRKKGKCTFTSKECPECHEKNVKTTMTESHIEGACGCKVKIKDN